MAKKINKFKNLPPNTAVADLIGLIEQELPLFPKSSQYTAVTQTSKNETAISEAFCLFMLNQAHNTNYKFINESGQKGNSKVDIAVYYGNTVIFTIEAKIFPIPVGTNKSNPRDEHEYVYTTSKGKQKRPGGGINRFKHLYHGLDKAGVALSESGMLGYIKENGFPHWLKKVNKWIGDAGWGTSEQLQKSANFGKTMGILESNHQRTDGSNIKLTHFWIKVS
jgi:hypothetical protein